MPLQHVPAGLSPASSSKAKTGFAALPGPEAASEVVTTVAPLGRLALMVVPIVL